jgi:hypothetical protein
MATTKDGWDALEVMGFHPVPLGDSGSPTPGRIADRLSDIVERLSSAIEARSWMEAISVRDEGRLLLLALDAWDAEIRDPSPVPEGQ